MHDIAQETLRIAHRLDHDQVSEDSSCELYIRRVAESGGYALHFDTSIPTAQLLTVPE